MRLFRTWKLGLKSLLLHPMRSALTVLGIFIGVASVIWLLAIGEGISREAQKQIEDLGAENIIVRSIKPPSSNSGSFRTIVDFGVTRAEAEMIRVTVSGVPRDYKAGCGSWSLFDASRDRRQAFGLRDFCSAG